MPKKGWLLAAIAWSSIVALLCLISFSDFPRVGIKGADKYVHVLFHFVFTILWFVYFSVRNAKITAVRNAIYVLLLSLCFGSLIELAQQYLTTTRTADIKDVAANLTGSLLGLFAILIAGRFQKIATNKNV